MSRTRKPCVACASRGLLLFLLVLTVSDSVIALLPLRADDAAKKDAAKKDGDVETLAAQLCSPVYAEREAATTALPKHGLAAIEPARKVALGDCLEGALRAVKVLNEVYLGEELDAFDSAEAALTELSQKGKPSVAQEAKEILDRSYFSIRQKRVALEIRNLGGQVQFETDRPVIIDGQPVYPPGGWVYAVAIGKDWKGGEDGLTLIKRLESLRGLYLLRGHSLSPKAIEDLVEALPAVQLMERGAAFVGVGTDTGTLGCTIGSVKPGSPGDKAGLLPGDIVVEIAGKGVKSTDDLIKVVGEHDAGETLNFVLLRGDPLLRFKLTELLNDPEEQSPLLLIGILSQMRTSVDVTLAPWQIDN